MVCEPFNSIIVTINKRVNIVVSFQVQTVYYSSYTR